MKTFLIVFLIVHTSVYGQLTLNTAQDSLQKYYLGTSTYFDDFLGHPGYGASIILTKDGGAAGFGDGDNGIELTKLTKEGKVQWRRSISRNRMRS